MPVGLPVAPARLPALLLLAAALASCRAGSARPASPAPPATAAASPAAASPAGRDAWLAAFARGYFPGRSGQLFVVPREGEFLVDAAPEYRFMHGSHWPYDTHVPLLFHGPGFVRTMTSAARVAHQDVVPTLAALLGTQPPATAARPPLREALAPAATRPRVVALLVLDGMRADYLDTYQAVLPTLSRLRAEGASFTNAHVASAPTLTAGGHASLGTGADPRVHGLVVNRIYNRVTGKDQEAYDRLDPGELFALTLADVWNIETEGQAVIIGQGGQIRATAGLVGHGACLINGRPILAASYKSSGDGGWETNERCYAMPKALAGLTAKRYWTEAGGAWMGHDIAHPGRLRHSALFQRFEGDALVAVLESEPIGADAVPDLVLVNFKAPDYVGHAYGPASPEIKETLAELDRQIARALAVIERKAGRGNVAVAITADHGMPGEPKRPEGRRYLADIVKRIDARYPVPGGGSLVQYFGDPANLQIHLDTARLREMGLTPRAVADFLAADVPFAAVFTEDEVRAAQRQLDR
jgi:predicted AlkP superfamily pyrophosphatase or phosphodiesterase